MDSDRPTVRPFILDNSVVMAWLFMESSPYAQFAVGKLAAQRAIVPFLWPMEFANAIVTARRRGRISVAEATHLQSMALRLPIDVDTTAPSASVSEVIDLALGHGLTAYDASYLLVTLRHGGELATLDDELRRAATSLGVFFRGN